MHYHQVHHRTRTYRYSTVESSRVESVIAMTCKIFNRQQVGLTTCNLQSTRGHYRSSIPIEGESRRSACRECGGLDLGFLLDYSESGYFAYPRQGYHVPAHHCQIQMLSFRFFLAQQSTSIVFRLGSDFLCHFALLESLLENVTCDASPCFTRDSSLTSNDDQHRSRPIR